MRRYESARKRMKASESIDAVKKTNDSVESGDRGSIEVSCSTVPENLVEENLEVQALSQEVDVLRAEKETLLTKISCLEQQVPAIVEPYSCNP